MTVAVVVGVTVNESVAEVEPGPDDVVLVTTVLEEPLDVVVTLARLRSAEAPSAAALGALGVSPHAARSATPTAASVNGTDRMEWLGAVAVGLSVDGAVAVAASGGEEVGLPVGGTHRQRVCRTAMAESTTPYMLSAPAGGATVAPVRFR
jgi:hypothetical protein